MIAIIKVANHKSIDTRLLSLDDLIKLNEAISNAITDRKRSVMQQEMQLGKGVKQ